MSVSVFPAHPVLLVDDDPGVLQSITAILRLGAIHNVMRCDDSRQVMGIIEDKTVCALLLDLSMPHLGGQDLLPMIVEQHPEIPVLVVTGMNDLETAVKCMRNGAFDYMVKPVEEQRMISAVRRAIEIRELHDQYAALKQGLLSPELRHPEAFNSLITSSPKMHAVFRYAETIARTSRPVLITGETGVGKELVARAVHTLSERRGAFVAVNVAGLDDTAFSDSLFGHVRGAFTGADSARAGLIEQAKEGTLFLDEIGDLKPDSQVKLLRLLQEREYFPLGADMPKLSHARVILATHRDLDSMLSDQSFRKDLFYRLQVHRIHVPPLRERLEDIPLLLERFLEDAANALGKARPAMTREIVSLLSTHSFPGNVRELEAVVFEAMSRHEGGKLSLAVFKEHILRLRSASGELGTTVPTPSGMAFQLFPGRFPTLSDAAEYLVAEALRRSDGNQSVAAELLGITPSALNKRLKRAQGRSDEE